MKPLLYVGNQNYSSWSLRPWLVLRWSGLEFETRVVPMGGVGYGNRSMPAILSVSPSGTVPALHLGSEVISDSLAISEWAAEQAPALWPEDPIARMHARAAACEMHSGFSAMRAKLPCNIRRRTEPRQLEADVQRDVDRVFALWTNLRGRFGGSGPFLFGAKPTIADAFFTPVATRLRTYGVTVPEAVAPYVQALLGEPSFLEWEQAGIAESWTMPIWDSV
jgi:glutathione S-transferase